MRTDGAEVEQLKLWQRITERRHRRRHERSLRERERQDQLEQQDVEEAVRDIAAQSGPAQQP